MNDAIPRFLQLCLIITLTSCDSDNSQLAEGGIGGTGVQPASVSVGAISGFGSVIVNGVAFDTSTATIISNGQQVTQDNLRIGFVVRVEGDVAAATADRIEYAVLARGPVENLSIIDVDTQAATLHVLGQPVITNSLTNFQNVDLVDLKDGAIIAISGMRDAQDEIVTSFLGLSGNPTEFRAIGRVGNLDETAMTFSVSGLTVDFSGTAVSGLTDGALVEVIGASGGFTSPVLTADTVIIRAGLNAKVGIEVEVEGIVTDATNAPASFVISDGTVVNTSSETKFEDGSASDITLNAKVEVEGTIDDNGIVQADKVEIERPSDVRITAQVDALDATAGTLTVLEVPIATDSTTRFEDKSGGGRRAFGLGDISAGDYLKVNGFVLEGNFMATRIRKKKLKNKVTLRAPIEDFDADAGTITLLDFVIATDTQTNFGKLSSQDEFFANIVTGASVKVEWNPFQNTGQPADSVKLEKDN